MLANLSSSFILPPLGSFSPVFYRKCCTCCRCLLYLLPHLPWRFHHYPPLYLWRIPALHLFPPLFYLLFPYSSYLFFLIRNCCTLCGCFLYLLPHLPRRLQHHHPRCFWRLPSLHLHPLPVWQACRGSVQCRGQFPVFRGYSWVLLTGSHGFHELQCHI